MSSEYVSTPLWRVVFTIGAMRPSHMADRGPWHPQRAVVESWVDWFRKRGQQARLQASNGDIYENGQVVVKAGRLH